MIQPATVELIPSFYECLKSVAAERIYIEMLEPPAFERVEAFQRQLIETGGSVFYAVDEQRVVGWCDVSPLENPRMSHRGSLGMGLLAAYRGRGLGTRLLKATLAQAQALGLEKVELQVYVSNTNALSLYRKTGFVEEGLIKSYRKLDGQTFDVISMAKFL